MTKYTTETKIFQDAFKQIKEMDNRIEIIQTHIIKHEDLYLIHILIEEDGYQNETTGVYDKSGRCLYTLDHFSRIKIHNNNVLCFLDLPMGLTLVTHYKYNGEKLLTKNNLQITPQDESDDLLKEEIIIITEKDKKRLYHLEKGFDLNRYDSISTTFDKNTLKFTYKVSATNEDNEEISTNLIGFMGTNGVWLINILHDELQEKPVKITEENDLNSAIENTKTELKKIKQNNGKRVLKK